MNWFLTLLFFAMLVYHGYYLARYRRPYRIAFLGFWGLLAYAHLVRQEDLYPLIGLSLVVAIYMRKREPAAVAKIVRQDFERAGKPSSHSQGVWDKDLGGR